jgi:uncharacterized membrane protein
MNEVRISPMSARRIALLGLLMMGLAFRLSVCDRAIWFDERFTLLHTSSLDEALRFSEQDVHPPLHLLVTALWRSVLPSSELSLRVSSLLFGMVSLIGIYLVGGSLGGWRIGVGALAIAVFSPMHWTWSTMIRPYPLLLAFSALSTWAFLEVLKAGRVRDWVVLGIVSVANLYAHYFAWFLLAAQGIVFVIHTLMARGGGAGTPVEASPLWRSRTGCSLRSLPPLDASSPRPLLGLGR